MSFNLHVVLIFDPTTNNLIAEIYDGTTPNFLLPVPFVINGLYRFFRNGVLINQVVGGDVVSSIIPPPVGTESFLVTVNYTANGIGQPVSTSTLVVGPNYIYGDFLTQTTIPGGVVLTVTAPLGVTPTNIQWAHNYQIFVPTNPLTTIANGNGVYEIRFTGLENGHTYISAVNVTGSQPAKYLLTIGSDGNLYGTFGTPRNVTLLAFIPENLVPPLLYHIYVNGIQYSDNSSIVITRLDPGTVIDVVVTDCCGTIVTANTTILA